MLRHTSADGNECRHWSSHDDFTKALIAIADKDYEHQGIGGQTHLTIVDLDVCQTSVPAGLWTTWGHSGPLQDKGHHEFMNTMNCVFRPLD